MTQQEVQSLIQGCARRGDGDATSWAELIERFGYRLAGGVRRALRRCGVRVHREEMQDLIQEVFCRLLERDRRPLRICRATSEEALGAYLGKIAERVALDHLRAAAAAKRGQALQARECAEDAPGCDALAVDSGPSPEERLLTRERRRLALRRCGVAASASNRRRDLQVFYLAFYQGMSSREICQRLGGAMSVVGVDTVVSRMRKRLAARGVRLPRRAGRSGL